MMSRLLFSVLRILSVVLVLVLTAGLLSVGVNHARAASLGIMNFASAANGGTAISTGGTATNPGGAIDGVIPGAGGIGINTASWPGAGGYVTGATWVGTLGPEGPQGSVSEIRVYDRGCCASVAPYSIELLDASNTVIFSDSLLSNSPQLRPAVFSVPNLTGATKVRLTNLGAGGGDAYLHEVEVIGLNNHVGGAGAIGSDSLQSTITGSGTPGDLADARMVQLTLNGPVTPERADISEFRVLDTGLNNIALSTAGGLGYHRVDGSPTNAITYTGDGPFLNDNNTTTFSDQLGGIGDYYGIELAANSTLDSLEIVNRTGCCGGHGNMQLDVYSDTARTNLIYTKEVNFTNVAGSTTPVAFELGGLATASMLDGQTYIFEIDANTNTNDTLVVPLAQATTSAIVFDGDLVVQLLNGIPDVGVQFQLFEADSFSGTFDSITLPTLPTNYVWSLSNLYSTGSIAVTLVPEPSTFALLGLFGLGMVVRKRRRGR